MRWIAASSVVVNVITFVYFLWFLPPSAEELFVEERVRPASRTVTLLSELAEKKPVQLRTPKPSLVAPSNAGFGSQVGSRDAKAAVPVVQQPLVDPLCTLVGPFEKLLRAEYFVERLLALGLQADIKHLVVSSEPRYWLFLVPESSRRAALRRLSELQSRGIDSYVIPSGDLENGVSLGMFARRDLADAMLADIRRKGYEPKIKTIARDLKEIWVFLPHGESVKIADERWLELLGAEKNLQKRQNLCVDVASE